MPRLTDHPLNAEASDPGGHQGRSLMDQPVVPPTGSEALRAAVVLTRASRNRVGYSEDALFAAGETLAMLGLDENPAVAAKIAQHAIPVPVARRLSSGRRVGRKPRAA